MTQAASNIYLSDRLELRLLANAEFPRELLVSEKWRWVQASVYPANAPANLSTSVVFAGATKERCSLRRVGANLRLFVGAAFFTVSDREAGRLINVFQFAVKRA